MDRILSSGLRRRLQELKSGSLKRHAVFSARWEYGALRLDEAVQGREITTSLGSHLLVQRPAVEFIQGSRAFFQEPRDPFIGNSFPSRIHELSSDVHELALCSAAQVLYLDIETCGLRGAPLFLVGILSGKGDGILIEQRFARDYSEEGSVLEGLNQRISQAHFLVTFNGKSFDMPFIADRSYVCGLRPPKRPSHVDLLHESRRIFRRRFGNCRLQTLETHLCGRTRFGDIPGSLIPQAYHDFVRTGNARPIRSILRHNALDLITMAELLAILLGGLR